MHTHNSDSGGIDEEVEVSELKSLLSEQTYAVYVLLISCHTLILCSFWL